jgi:hypothetical protein
VRIQLGPRRATKKIRIALAASVLAHGLALLLLTWLEGRRPASPVRPESDGDRIVSVELRSEAPPPPSATPAPGPSSGEPTTPGRKDRRPPDRRPGDSSLRMRGTRALPSPRDLALAIVGRDGVPVASQSGDEGEVAPMAEQLDGQLREGQARDNVRSGRVHPQLHDVLRGARARFEAQRARVAAAGETLGRDQRPFLRGYIREIRRQLHAEAYEGAPTAARKGAPPMLGYRNRLRAAARARADRLTCTVCLALAAGKPPELTVAETSGSLTFDRAARESMAVVAPSALASDARPGRACYRFTGLYYPAPLVPDVFCLPDEQGDPTCKIPGKPVVELQVTLDSVDYAPHPPPIDAGTLARP